MTELVERRRAPRLSAHRLAVWFARESVRRCGLRQATARGQGSIVLMIDGVAARRGRMTATLEDLGYRTLSAWTPLDAIAHLERSHGQVVFAAIAEDALDGRLLRRFLAEAHPEIHVVVIADRVRTGTIVEGQLAASAPAFGAL